MALVKKELFDEAIEALDKCISINPDDNEAFYNLGIAYFNKQEYDNAITNLNKSISISPNDFSPHDALGSVYYAIQDYDKSLESFEKAAKLAPSNPGALYNLAFLYFTKEKYTESRDAFEKVIKVNPGDEEAHFNLASVYLKLKNYEKAKEVYEKILAKSPENEDAKTALEKVIKTIETGKQENFIEEIGLSDSRLARKKGSAKDSNIFYLEGMELLRKKNLPAAISKLKKAKEMDPHNLKASEDLESVYKLLKTSKELVDKGNTYITQKNLLPAIECYKKSLEINASDEEIKEKLSTLRIAHAEQQKHLKVKSIESSQQLINMGDYTQAINILEAFVAQSPEDVEGHFNLGKAYKENSDYILAKDSLNNALKLDPNNQEIQSLFYEVVTLVNTVTDDSRSYLQLGLRYVQQNEHQKAFEAFKKALDLNPNNPEIQKKVGELSEIILKNKKSLSSGSSVLIADIDKELQKYQDLIKNNPEDANAHYNLAIVYNKMEKYTEAMSSLKRVLDIDSSYKEAQNLMFDVFKSMNE